MHGRIYYFTDEKTPRKYDEDEVYTLMEETDIPFDYTREIDKSKWKEELSSYFNFEKETLKKIVKKRDTYMITFNRKGIEEYLKHVKKESPLFKNFEDVAYLRDDGTPIPFDFRDLTGEVLKEGTWFQELLDKMNNQKKEEVTMKVEGIYDFHY